MGRLSRVDLSRDFSNNRLQFSVDGGPLSSMTAISRSPAFRTGPTSAPGPQVPPSRTLQPTPGMVQVGVGPNGEPLWSNVDPGPTLFNKTVDPGPDLFNKTVDPAPTVAPVTETQSFFNTPLFDQSVAGTAPVQAVTQQAPQPAQIATPQFDTATSSPLPTPTTTGISTSQQLAQQAAPSFNFDAGPNISSQSPGGTPIQSAPQVISPVSPSLFQFPKFNQMVRSPLPTVGSAPITGIQPQQQPNLTSQGFDTSQFPLVEMLLRLLSGGR